MDNDLWGHLYFGREVLQGGKLPPRNLYSYTAPNHTWIIHEWLAEVFIFGIYHLFGSPGLVLLKVALGGGGIVWILNPIIKKRTVFPAFRILTLAWMMAILSPGFNVRPQLFTYFLFAPFIFLFYRYEERGQAVLYWIPSLTVF